MRMFQLIYCVIHIQSYSNIFFEWKFPIRTQNFFNILFFINIFVFFLYIYFTTKLNKRLFFFLQTKKKEENLIFVLDTLDLQIFFYHWVFIWKRYLTSNMLLKIIFILFAKIVFRVLLESKWNLSRLFFPELFLISSMICKKSKRVIKNTFGEHFKNLFIKN